ncbi:helix-turn-helix domain-containing protein [Gandjariella thermophila]|uniref:Transcriptional regulator n=1 Tax=Gandjariella thermophila TaxID=1931992 RepID=A0A4D4J7L3_9PSEU|nr:helix-turn-helix transcriptional regulator [Gandjariella thermophila]GDY29853.1 transcriptional regulator [Gandjariella thermophila]
MDIEDVHIGRRVREIRTWRGMSLTATAGLAGISVSYLSMIERGQRPVTKRSVLEALAKALKVSPVELIGGPYETTSSTSNAANQTMAAVEDAVSGWWLGEVPEVPGRPWPQVRADVDLLTSKLRPNSDYSAQTALLPDLIRDLLVAATDPTTRQDALIGLMYAYHAASNVAKRLRFAGLPTLAVERMRRVAEELDDPVWCSFVSWARAHVLSGSNRPRQYQLAVAAADMPHARPETRGMANLTAALASAAQGKADVAETHLSEAAAIAELIEPDVSPWGHVQFGRTNVGIWRVAIGVELGQGAKVAEVAQTVRPETITQSRAAAFWIDYGRGLLAERKTQERGLRALLQAEKLAPQQLRNNPFVREAVTNLLSAARRDAGGRELRGLAWRIGVAPSG